MEWLIVRQLLSSPARPGISFHVKGKKELFLGAYRPKSRIFNGFWPLKGKSWAFFSFHAALFQFRCPITSGMTEKEDVHDGIGGYNTEGCRA